MSEMMIEIIKVFRAKTSAGSCQWLMLECGHWLKWSGQAMRAGQEMRCPSCGLQKRQPVPEP